MRSRILVSVVSSGLLALTACSSGPKHFDNEAFKANPKKVAKSMTDTSGTGVLDDSKKVLVPDFKVYFETQTKAAGMAGDNRVSQKVKLAVDPKVLQEITDQIYKQFVSDLQAAGYTVIEHAEIAKQHEEFAKFYEKDMKAGPVVVNDTWTEYVPTGMKLDWPGMEIGAPSLGGIFGTNLRDVMGRATKKMDAIYISPSFLVGFADSEVEKGYNRTTVTTHQGISIRPGSAWFVGARGSWGHIKLEKPIGSPAEFGQYVDANTAGDTVRGFASALSYALGGSTNNTSTKLLQADSEKYKNLVLGHLMSTQAVLMERAKYEME